MKIIKTIILTFIVVLIALPWVSAKDEKLDIAITDYCYFERADFVGNMGIVVPFVIKNTGDVQIINPRVDFFLNDGIFTEDNYPGGFHTGYQIYGLDYYKRVLEPGKGYYEENSTFFFAYYAYYPNDLYRGSKVHGRIVLDWLNELQESNENNNEVEFEIDLTKNDSKRCKLGNDLSSIPHYEPDIPIEIPPATNVDTNQSNITAENNETGIIPDITITPSNKTINISPYSYDLLIEKDVKMYKYVNSHKREENYGKVYTANYQRQKFSASASIVVFENKKQAMKYLSDKIKNSEKSGYEKGRNVYFLKNPSDRTFIWVSGNYAITVSDYGNKMPNQLLQTYLEKYPRDLGTGRK